MLTDTLVEALQSQGEGPSLDYKAERYKFAKASDEDKSELLKDILALANTQRAGDAYILIGFKENPPYPAEVVGLPAKGAIDDSRIQQFVNEKLENKLVFKYEEQLFQGKHIAVISIPKQPRPFYVSKKFGNVEANTVYVRRGSSTGIATVREIYRMGIADLSKGDALIDLAVLDEANRPLSGTFERTFLTFEELPNFAWAPPGFMEPPSYQHANKNYWREGAEYHVAHNRMVHIRLTVTNRSVFALSNVKLEVTWSESSDQGFKMLTAGDLPQVPAEEWNVRMFTPGDPETEVDEEGQVPILNARIGNLLPGETKRMGEDLVLLPNGPGDFVMTVRILAAELNQPLIIERSISVKGEAQELSFEDLQNLLDADD